MNNDTTIIINTFYKIEHYQKIGITLGTRQFNNFTNKLKAADIYFVHVSCPVHGNILIVSEPDFKFTDKIVWEKIAHKILNIKEGDICPEPALIGDLKFWGYFEIDMHKLIRHGFSQLNNEEIGTIYNTNGSDIERKFAVIFETLRLKYPSYNIINRASYRIFGIDIKVHCPKRCDKCNHVL